MTSLVATDPADRLIVAIDEPDLASARALIARLEGAPRWLKIGMTLFYSAGPAVVREVIAHGYRVFVDLKCHDIPHQVGGAVRALTDLGAGLLTIHTGGGPAMMRAAASAAEGTDAVLLGVTVLTSLDASELAAVGATPDPAGLALQRALLAAECGLGGVVSSPLEAASIRTRLPAPFEIVTPGVRPAGSAAGDQRRVATPAAAIAAGASRLVVGRPITHAAEPAVACQAILAEIAGASAGLGLQA